MPIRLGVRRIMVAVALVGVCLALGRVHISLGSFAFGALGIAWIRTAESIRSREAAGRSTTPARRLALFVRAMAGAVLILIACLIPAALFAPALFMPRWSHQRPFNTSAANWYLIICGMFAYAFAWADRTMRSSRPGEAAQPRQGEATPPGP